MYAKLGRLSEARVVYDRIDEKDVVLATALIVGCTQNGDDSEAIRVFGDMVKSGVRANEYTFASVLRACGNAGELREGMMIHSVIIKTGFESRVDSQTSLLGMYSKCGLIDDTVKVFDEILNPNTVTWTAMIGCLVCSNKEELAFSKFRKMIRECVDVSESTLSTVLRGCSSLALFELGKLIHAHAQKVGLDRDIYVGAALIDMYGKCAHIGMAKMVFDSLQGLDLVSVNSLIYGYAQNGYGEEAVSLFDLMQSSGLKPNGATFISVLSACSNAGMLKEGLRIFSSMDDYKMVPSNEHYACVVDLLGRAGRLKEAEELINQNSNPDKVLWRALLGACKIHGDVKVGKVAARRILEIDPGDDGTYVLMSNIYASSHQWDEVSRMKSKIRNMKLKKIPAMSWLEVNRETHTFMAGDWSHPQALEIYKELEGLIRRTKELGYVPDTSFVLQELDEMEKERSLYYHSEKLAIAFGLLSLKSKKNNCIMILKNLRVCGDCHTWMKLVSKVLGSVEIAILDSLLPDILGRLSSQNLKKEAFCNIMQFLINSIKKDKQMEGLVEKLCNRFSGVTDVRQWECFAFCLSQLTFSDKGVKKLIDSFKSYEHVLSEDSVTDHFRSIINKCKKFAKAELKSSIEEYEEKLNKVHMERKEQEITARNAKAHQQKVGNLEGLLRTDNFAKEQNNDENAEDGAGEIINPEAPESTLEENSEKSVENEEKNIISEEIEENSKESKLIGENKKPEENEEESKKCDENEENINSSEENKENKKKSEENSCNKSSEEISCISNAVTECEADGFEVQSPKTLRKAAPKSKTKRGNLSAAKEPVASVAVRQTRSSRRLL